ncbi:MAG TPA: SRPBCC domain-containing protein [Actinophytocola sp.]|uniref:SRPBCC domain-containing protein n=1 Tax=Actinophytocola sp. TaxID=1872138 RepID=UPI002DB844FB|nr:SRPBCC domain-containing protein [Actinophytocola sp.]HEU5474033.1 SRPBCC domain-containing protein [Actinophytocola sp.]
MAASYAVRRTINASPDKVWAVLTDAAGYPEWNTAVVSLRGRIALGEKVKLVSVVDPKRTFTLKVAELDRPHRMVWASGMPFGLFKGVRTYELRPNGNDGTEFAMAEEFSGPLAPMITKAIPDLTESFEQWADGLKQASEG